MQQLVLVTEAGTVRGLSRWTPCFDDPEQMTVSTILFLEHTGGKYERILLDIGQLQAPVKDGGSALSKKVTDVQSKFMIKFMKYIGKKSTVERTKRWKSFKKSMLKVLQKFERNAHNFTDPVTCELKVLMQFSNV